MIIQFTSKASVLTHKRIIISTIYAMDQLFLYIAIIISKRDSITIM